MKSRHSETLLSEEIALGISSAERMDQKNQYMCLLRSIFQFSQLIPAAKVFERNSKPAGIPFLRSNYPTTVDCNSQKRPCTPRQQLRVNSDSASRTMSMPLFNSSFSFLVLDHKPGTTALKMAATASLINGCQPRRPTGCKTLTGGHKKPESTPFPTTK